MRPDSVSELGKAQAEAAKLIEKQGGVQERIQQCEEKLTQLIGDIFIGNEMVPDIIDKPPLYPLDLTYRYLEVTV